MTAVPRELVVVPFRAHQYLWGLIDPRNQTSTSLNMLFTDNQIEILHALSAQHVLLFSTVWVFRHPCCLLGLSLLCECP